MQHCTNCGHPFPETLRFCLLCGSPLMGPPGPPGEAEPAPVLAARFRIEDLLDESPLGQLHQAVDLARDEGLWVRLVPARHFPAPTLLERALRELRPFSQELGSGLFRVVGSGRTPAGDLYCAFRAPPPEALALDRWLQAHGTPPPEQARRLVLQVGEALHKAQEQGILHRNLAPYTIFVLPEEQVLLVDFGLCECHEVSWRIVQGAPHFLAPEQAQGRSITEASSVYSLAALCYYLLTGVPPAAGEDVAAVLAQVTGVVPPPPSQLAPGLPPQVDELLLRALEKNAEHRPQTLRSLLDELAGLEGLLLTAPLGPPAEGSIHTQPTMPLPWPRPPVIALPPG